MGTSKGAHAMLSVSSYQSHAHSSDLWSRCCLGGLVLTDGADYCGANIELQCDPRWNYACPTMDRESTSLNEPTEQPAVPMSLPTSSHSVQDSGIAAEWPPQQEMSYHTSLRKSPKLRDAAIASEWPPEPE